ncbi:MAG: glycosyltransferase, partial [Alphaproteobacteria bacterium]|nr:glycosyltransferase [Alphaproteobacteria bacterium]
AKKNPFVYMKHAIANVLSSYSEGLPTVLLESAVVGTLNIASKCRFGPREILLNGRGGVLFEPGNAKQLAMCMGDVYNNSVNVTEMIKESTDALKRFKADEVVNQIISLFS